MSSRAVKIHLVRTEKIDDEIEQKGHEIKTYCGMRGFYHKIYECDTADGNRFEISFTLHLVTCSNCRRYKAIEDEGNHK